MIKLKDLILETDVGLTYKKGKTVTVIHKKSGKEIVIIDNPNVRKEYEKIGFFAEGKLEEGKWSKIMTSVRKGSKAGPWSIVVYKNKKVIHQRLVKILQQIPAHYSDVKKKYPRDSIGIEDKYGARVYTEGKLNESLFVALVLKRRVKDKGFSKDISQFQRQGIKSGILQASADKIFKSEVSRNVDKEAAVNLKNLKQYGQAGLKGSKNPSGRQRQFIDAISGEIKNADKKNNYHIKDGHIINATKNLDLVFSTSSSGIEKLLKKKYKVTK